MSEEKETFWGEVGYALADFLGIKTKKYPGTVSYEIAPGLWREFKYFCEAYAWRDGYASGNDDPRGFRVQEIQRRMTELERERFVEGRKYAIQERHMARVSDALKAPHRPDGRASVPPTGPTR